MRTIFDPSTTTAALRTSLPRPSRIRAARITISAPWRENVPNRRTLMSKARMRRSVLVFLMLIGGGATASAQLTTMRAGVPELLIPAAGAVSGANGTFFRSDITVVNYRTDADQRVRFTWLAENANGASAPVLEMNVAKSTGFTSEDFVTDILKQSGLGSILITAIDSSGNFDSGGKLHATARIWSNQPGLSSGTVSQSFPVIAVSDINVMSGKLVILSQRRDDRYRTNVGIINLDPQAQTFRVTVQ